LCAVPTWRYPTGSAPTKMSTIAFPLTAATLHPSPPAAPTNAQRAAHVVRQAQEYRRGRCVTGDSASAVASVGILNQARRPSVAIRPRRFKCSTVALGYGKETFPVEYCLGTYSTLPFNQARRPSVASAA
jgi:hypothetical protein